MDSGCAIFRTAQKKFSCGVFVEPTFSPLQYAKLVMVYKLVPHPRAPKQFSTLLNTPPFVTHSGPSWNNLKGKVPWRLPSLLTLQSVRRLVLTGLTLRTQSSLSPATQKIQFPGQQFLSLQGFPDFWETLISGNLASFGSHLSSQNPVAGFPPLNFPYCVVFSHTCS